MKATPEIMVNNKFGVGVLHFLKIIPNNIVMRLLHSSSLLLFSTEQPNMSSFLCNPGSRLQYQSDSNPT